jgi:hypothetical protein
MQQTYSHEANSCWTSPDILHLLPNPTVDYRFNKTQVLDPILNQLSEVHFVIKYFLKIYFNIILPLC